MQRVLVEEEVEKMKNETKALCALEKIRRNQNVEKKQQGIQRMGRPSGKLSAHKKESNVIQPVTDLNDESQISESEVDKAWTEHWRCLSTEPRKKKKHRPETRRKKTIHQDGMDAVRDTDRVLEE
ncbi:MAG: uncharacterized protein A8A55_3306 [Amphiamblys sp. WSBS2006]|nr:MAG: uncharacterized protein A8A55_3306 [Amphiamblys sp. WSBS2006]